MSQHLDTSLHTDLTDVRTASLRSIRTDPAHSPLVQKSYLVIPARLASTRLPRKLLLRETGKSLIQHTYEAARHARRPSGVCVATDHEEIFREVQSFGGQAVMTDPTCPKRHRSGGRGRPGAHGRGYYRQRARRRAGVGRRVDRSGY